MLARHTLIEALVIVYGTITAYILTRLQLNIVNLLIIVATPIAISLISVAILPFALRSTKNIIQMIFIALLLCL